MNNIYENLAWLPITPDNFSSKLAEVSGVSELRQLSKYALDDNFLRRLSKKNKNYKMME